LGIPIDYYISVDFEGFVKMVDKVGGVDILVEKDLYDPFYPANNMIDYAPFKISAGLHHMDGATALKYARSRETTSDFDRSRRQEQVLVAVKEKILSSETLANPIKITELINLMGSHIRTNFSINEIRAFWDNMKGLDTSNIINKVFDTAPGSPLTALTDERGYIIIPKKGIGNYTDLQVIVQNIFTADTSTHKELQIEILNGTSKSGLATQISQLLQSYGYKVAKVGNATTTISQTTIYNCAGSGADATAKDLSQILKAVVKTKTACSGIDIQIILGQNSL
jgi:anionic cell wall polymer biosynthesis LytR-Cps2A-Psr (LCP) family protein